MREVFIKYKIVIFRVIGTLMLLVGFLLFFWMSPKEGISENEIALANVARMEASIHGASKGSSKQSQKPDVSKFVQSLQNAQLQQMRYFTIASMVFGVLFLLYSFISKPKNDSEI
jgi:uncharacterized protein YjeT (DUF2065 family)